MIVAGTGHRPDKLEVPGMRPYSPEQFLALTRFAQRQLLDVRATSVISGMALGWDMALAQAALNLGLPLTAAVPFAGQEGKWPALAQAQYRGLLARAERVEVVCSGGYAPQKMQRRNEWMVFQCELLLALWDGSPGGTANCVLAAEKRGRLTRHLWPAWEAFRGPVG